MVKPPLIAVIILVKAITSPSRLQRKYFPWGDIYIQCQWYLNVLRINIGLLSGISSGWQCQPWVNPPPPWSLAKKNYLKKGVNLRCQGNIALKCHHRPKTLKEKLPMKTGNCWLGNYYNTMKTGNGCLWNYTMKTANGRLWNYTAKVNLFYTLYNIS